MIIFQFTGCSAFLRIVYVKSEEEIVRKEGEIKKRMKNIGKIKLRSEKNVKNKK